MGAVLNKNIILFGIEIWIWVLLIFKFLFESFVVKETAFSANSKQAAFCSEDYSCKSNEGQLSHHCQNI